MIVADSELCGFRLRLKFRSHSRLERALPELKRVLKQCGWFRAQDFSLYQSSGLAIGSGPDPFHRAARLQVSFKVCARKDDAVRLRGEQAVPNLFRLDRKIEHKL